ncbi:MAG TPA: NAD(P)-binding domain-containing protein [Micromonosporaceae bacterium]|nr:NAD(P)-binding domain-containing protein [Micromonosporaceae bacterium]
MQTDGLRIAVLGLGEAGSAFSADLAAAGADVVGYDPRQHLPIPSSVRRAASVAEAVAGAELALSLNSARVAEAVAAEALPAMRPGAVFADLNTSAPELKRRIAAMTASHGIAFAEVAVMAPVPGRGVSVPSVAAGPGAPTYADALARHGGRVEVLDAPVGTASTRKLLRSIVMKGLAASIVEALDAADRVGSGDWLRSDLANQFGAELAERLERGTRMHAARRVDEMRAASELLVELGVAPLVTEATVQRLAQVAATAGPSAQDHR